MSEPAFSSGAMAEAIERVARYECLKPLHARESEVELLLAMLREAARKLRGMDKDGKQ